MSVTGAKGATGLSAQSIMNQRKQIMGVSSPMFYSATSSGPVAPVARTESQCVDQVLSHVTLPLETLSKKIATSYGMDVMDVHSLLLSICNSDEQTMESVSSPFKKFATALKLINSDDIAITTSFMHGQVREYQEEDRKSIAEYNRQQALREVSDELDRLDSKQPSKAKRKENTPRVEYVSPRAPAPVISYRDQVLRFMDKVSMGSIDSLDEHVGYQQFLKGHGIELIKRGWLIRYYDFENPVLANEFREKIIKNKIKV